MNLRATALKLLNKREHSTQEFQQKLLKKFPDAAQEIEKLTQEFIKQDWLSDERYTESLIRDSILITKSGPNKIQQKLYQKNIPTDIARQTLDKIYPEEKQLEIAKKLAQKKQEELKRRKPDLKNFELNQKITTFLAGKGFPINIAKKTTM